MTVKRKKDIRKMLGDFLRKRREDELKITSVRQLSFDSNLDQSKLTKIEKGQIDFRFDTLIELARTYKLPLSKILSFDIPFWNEDEK
jgi:transcriptional regulator with XRE-family HTH domain